MMAKTTQDGDDDHGIESGSAYFFTRSNGVWSEQQKLTASDGAPVDAFGYSVAIDGDTAMIGAFRDDDNGFEERITIRGSLPNP